MWGNNLATAQASISPAFSDRWARRRGQTRLWPQSGSKLVLDSLPSFQFGEQGLQEAPGVLIVPGPRPGAVAGAAHARSSVNETSIEPLADLPSWPVVLETLQNDLVPFGVVGPLASLPAGRFRC